MSNKNEQLKPVEKMTKEDAGHFSALLTKNVTTGTSSFTPQDYETMKELDQRYDLNTFFQDLVTNISR